MDDDCRRVLDELWVYLDRECPNDLASAIHLHIEHCPPCLDRAEFELQLRLLIASKCRDNAPADLRERITARLLRDAGDVRGGV